MSLFNFFRRNGSNANAVNVTPVAEEVKENASKVDASLFVDYNQPEKPASRRNVNNPIQAFLDQNFDWIGVNDGYSNPQAEYMENRIKLFKADFRLAVDKALDEKRTALAELRIHAIRTQGLSQVMEAQVNEKIKQLEALIHELDVQKILSVENEGMIASGIHNYKIGFIRGLQKYQEEKFFAQSTGLFNF